MDQMVRTAVLVNSLLVEMSECSHEEVPEVAGAVHLLVAPGVYRRPQEAAAAQERWSAEHVVEGVGANPLCPDQWGCSVGGLTGVEKVLLRTTEMSNHCTIQTGRA